MGIFSNPALVMAVAALITSVISIGGFILQSRRDTSEYISKRISEAVQLSNATQELVKPLRDEVAEIRKDKKQLEMLTRSQNEQIERGDKRYQEEKAMRQAIEADRNQLLAQQIIWQKKIDACSIQIEDMKAEIERLKAEVARIKSEKAADDELFDPRELLG